MLEELLNPVSMPPTNVFYFLTAIACLLGLLQWVSKSSKRLDLPTFEVSSDVVATIEEAHRQVGYCFLPGLMSALTRL